MTTLVEKKTISVNDLPVLVTSMTRYDIEVKMKKISYISEEYLGKTTKAVLNKEIKNASLLTEEEIAQVMEKVKTEKITDLWMLSKHAIEKSMKKLENLFKILEEQEPGAGYRVFIESGTLNPLEIYLQRYGSRKIGTEIKMPKIEGKCPFCIKRDNKDFMKKYEGAQTLNTRVIQTGQKNPLVIADEHVPHFFLLPRNKKADMITTAYQVHCIKNPERKNFLAHIHVGEGTPNLGHLNVADTHVHVKSGLTEQNQ